MNFFREFLNLGTVLAVPYKMGIYILGKKGGKVYV